MSILNTFSKVSSGEIGREGGHQEPRIKAMLRSSALGLWAGLLGACAPDLALQSHRSPILDGDLEEGYDAVVLVAAGDGVCTGTVIGSQQVLTARHCADDVAAADIAILSGLDPLGGDGEL